MTNPKLRRGRNSRIGNCYAITMVCRNRAPTLEFPAYANTVLSEVCSMKALGWFQSHACVVMPDHMHWLLSLQHDSLSRCVQAFKSRTAHAINSLRGTKGPVWQSGFYDHCLRDDEDLRVQARYIIANPLRRGLVTRIEDYPYWQCSWVTTQADLHL